MILRSVLTSASMSALNGAVLCRPNESVMSSFFMSMVESCFIMSSIARLRPSLMTFLSSLEV